MIDSPMPLVLALGTPGQQPGWTFFVPFLLIFLIFYFLILLPTKRRQQKIQAFQGSLKVGDKVITTSGIYGTITKVDERSVQLQVAPKVPLEISRAAIAGYQGQEPVVTESGAP